MHRDHVPDVPAGFQLLGETPVAPNQGMVKFYSEIEEPENLHIFTVQGHPEFTKRIVDTVVRYREKSGVLSPEIATDAQRRADWHNDGVSIIGKLIWRIIRGPE